MGRTGKMNKRKEDNGKRGEDPEVIEVGLCRIGIYPDIRQIFLRPDTGCPAKNMKFSMKRYLTLNFYQI